MADLCSRLPYKVKCSYERILPEGYLLSDAQAIGTINNITIPFVGEITVKIDGSLRGLSDFKMYLRPLDSMTEEEENEYYALEELSRKKSNHGIDILDWLNSHHFDYRDLIGKGLALVAPKDMYKI